METLTSSKISQEVGASAEPSERKRKRVPVRPEWLRLPEATDVCGISRSSLYVAMREGKIRSVCLRKKNNQRGIRLINADSLYAFIESFAKEEAP